MTRKNKLSVISIKTGVRWKHRTPVLFYNLMCSKETNKAAFCSFEDVAVNLMIGAI